MSSGQVSSTTTFATCQFLLCIVFTCFSIVTSAQQSGYPVLTNVDSAEIWFDQIVSPKTAAIVNGPEYHIPFNGRKTHPFYQSSESDHSFVRYDNDLYPDLDLLYDIYGDILVLKYSNSTGMFFIKLDKNLVQQFDLYHHHFKKFSTISEDRYFDVLFEKKQFAVIVRRVKFERIEKGIRDYQEDDVAYLLDRGRWIKITGKNSFAKTVNKTQRKELSDFIKNNHIKLRKRKDDDLMKLGAFCYSLKERE